MSDIRHWVNGLSDRVRTHGTGALGEADAVRLARELIAREVSPGGPYRDDDGVPTREFNRSVATLFRLLGSPLAAVETYTGGAVLKRTPRRASGMSRLTPVQHQAGLVVNAFTGDLRRTAAEAYRRIIRADEREEISAISHLFTASLPGCETIGSTFSDGLGEANLMVWTAYSLYDDFIDNEGEPRFIPVANVTHRAAFARFLSAAPPDMSDECYRVFDGMDAANAWEVAHCRFAVADGTIKIDTLPRYKNHTVLAARARPHVLGPLIIARLARGSGTAPIARALDHYLIARQLNDDLHDWAEDFARGHISPVVARLLAAAGITAGTHAAADLHATMKKVFWNSEMAAASRYATSHVRRARRLLTGTGVGMAADSPFITRVIDPVENVLTRGLARHASDKKFLALYRSPASTLAR